MLPEVHIFPDNDAVAAGFAEWLVNWLKGKGEVSIALSGGSTPKVLFRLLAEQYEDAIDWSKVQLYWGDERCVPADDEDSNYGMTQELLLKHIDIPLANIHRVRGEDEPREEAVRYGEVIEEELELKKGVPVFDLIILGMGSDGHTASIFPHESELLLAETTCAVATHPESGQQRITLTGPVINQAKRVAFLVTGASKTDKVRQIIREEGDWLSFPAAHIRPSSGQLDWFLDEAAAAEL
ncbi:6-phosphogluconolactonase [Flavilitoribacter nigricans]|uniref:6-phosphogluconolactonase n=1 Tax=Flavilitoribacter nigricans (strain ATCC 23147 / DSM 23189 / NBRC 102662 / NCIMB 1420 / SS-2) TaxID=1122177 RepID=A0A2D0NBD6_FLAN2|nr:6-phosphogluconolactonase [Flavilitoribacter nigricans]PHN05489.1 6-phosphogluconolactonase [Flavilitoribacter nigricans DSM 23189 = NBRC 102662]